MAVAELWDRAVAGLYRYVLEPAGLSPSDVGWFADRVPQFILILVLFFVISKGLLWLLDKTVLSPRRVDPMLGQLLDQLLLFLFMFIGLAVAMLVFGVNVFNLALTLGLVGAALALGLQNTVANIMGGISLVSDRPFEVGDRVQIGEFWGDVEEIGLRSTRILTVRREYVIIPNRLMDEREIWNYTKRYPELRLDVEVQISYDSSLEIAKEILLDAARANAQVLSFPKPRIVLQGFHDSGMNLELQCYIADARDRYPIASALREALKEAFDRNGIEIPFPYRTLVYKKDLPSPRQPAEDAPDAAGMLGPRRILIATAGSTPALKKAETIVDVAEDLGADLVVAYIVPRASIVTRREGERAADIFQATARDRGVNVKLVIEEGDVVNSIANVVDNEGCGAVLIGAPRGPVLMAWKSADVEERLRRTLSVPLVVIPPDLEIDPTEIEQARRALDALAPRSDTEPAPGGAP